MINLLYALYYVYCLFQFHLVLFLDFVLLFCLEHILLSLILFNFPCFYELDGTTALEVEEVVLCKVLLCTDCVCLVTLACGLICDCYRLWILWYSVYATLAEWPELKYA